METIETLFDIVRTLRGENGCSWDQKQTAKSMWKCLAEEVYELQDAIVKEDLPNIGEEIGDVLFQLIFILEIYQEKKQVAYDEIIQTVAQKMIRRHPHVYEHSKDLSEAELNAQWTAIKTSEKKEQGIVQKSALDRVPKGMPALMRALNVSKCAVKEGFDWDDIHGALNTVRDEIDEFEAAVAKGNHEEANMEFGDILFSLVNVARFAGIYPENALADATEKFDGRFRVMERELNRRHIKLSDLNREEIDRLWDQAKKDHDPGHQDV